MARSAKPTAPVRPRSAMPTAAVEVDKDLRREYRRLSVELDTTMRALAEEAMRNYLPTLQKRVGRERGAL